MYNIGIIGTSKISEKKLIPAINKSKYVSFWSIFSNDYNRGLSFSKKFNACSPNPSHNKIESFLSDPELLFVMVFLPWGRTF